MKLKDLECLKEECRNCTKCILGETRNNIVFSDDYKILEYELNKIKNKYSVKYSGNELEYKVINYLFKKGFNLSDIKRCYDEN